LQVGAARACATQFGGCISEKRPGSSVALERALFATYWKHGVSVANLRLIRSTILAIYDETSGVDVTTMPERPGRSATWAVRLVRFAHPGAAEFVTIGNWKR
jgi:hypothetical protein